MMNPVLSDSRISRLVELALQEDAGMGDLTGEAVVQGGASGQAELICKEQGVLAGLEVARLVFHYCDPDINFAPSAQDGGHLQAGQAFAAIAGDARGILRGERTALNFLQRMSGIATLTNHFVRAVQGTPAKITDTRKTAPGLRVLDKWAVRLGGGVNHRFGLDDMVLIKDNHIVAAGGITEAVRRCRKYLRATGVAVPVEVETTSLAQVREALTCDGVQRIMLDNFASDEMRQAVELIGHRTEVEASGGITLANVRAVAESGVDVISIGALTHSAKSLDISLELTGLSGGR